jgi:GH35 family endo-1,4-beta-xylanase
MKDAGCNYVTVFMHWTGVEPWDGEFRFEEHEEKWRTEQLSEMGYEVCGYLIWFADWCTPSYVRRVGFNELKEEVYDYVYSTVRRFKKFVRIWNVVNEPHLITSNVLKLTYEEMREIIKVGIKAIRDADPEAKILINFTDIAGTILHFKHIPFARLYDEHISDYNVHPYKFLELLEGLDYDLVGLQFYYGAHLRGTGDKEGPPAMDLFTFSRILDKYSELGKPIYITEISVPSSFNDSWRIGCWHGGWDEQTQAEWLKGFYSICFSKPFVTAVSWWDANDRNSFITDGGLLDENNRPKEAYDTLKNLIRDFN